MDRNKSLLLFVIIFCLSVIITMGYNIKYLGHEKVIVSVYEVTIEKDSNMNIVKVIDEDENILVFETRDKYKVDEWLELEIDNHLTRGLKDDEILEVEKLK